LAIQFGHIPEALAAKPSAVQIIFLLQQLIESFPLLREQQPHRDALQHAGLGRNLYFWHPKRLPKPVPKV